MKLAHKFFEQSLYLTDDLRMPIQFHPHCLDDHHRAIVRFKGLTRPNEVVIAIPHSKLISYSPSLTGMEAY